MWVRSPVGSAFVAVVAAAVAAAATAFGALQVVLVGIAALLGGLLGLRSIGTVTSHARRIDPGRLLLYAYAASIPLNNLLPPGPAGTIARITGMIFFIGYLLHAPGVLRFDTIPTVGWLFIGWAFASSLWAISPDVSVTAWLSLAQLFAITVLIASIVSANRAVARGALWSYSVPAAITAIVAVTTGLADRTDLGRTAAFEDQSPAHFAGLLVPAVLFLMTEAQSAKIGRLIRAAAVICMTICIVAILLSGTRAAWMAIVIGTVWWVLLHPTRQQVTLLAGTAVAVVGILVASPVLLDFVMGRAEAAFTTGGSGRTQIWTVGVGILMSTPLIGVGFGNFPSAFTPYAIWEATGASHAGGALFAGRAAHNVLLGTAVETGIVGVVLLVTLFAYALMSARGTRMGDATTAMLIGLLTVWMFSDLTLRKELWFVTAMTLGFAHAARISRSDDRVQGALPAGAVAVPAAVAQAPAR